MEEGLFFWSRCLHFGFDFLWSLFSSKNFAATVNYLLPPCCLYTQSKGCPADEAQFIYYQEYPSSVPLGVMTLPSWAWYKRFKKPTTTIGEKALQHPPELALPSTPHCRDRIPASLLLWTYKPFFMTSRSSKAMSVLSAAFPISLALTYSCSTCQTLWPACAHLGSHEGALTTPTTGFGPRLPQSPRHRLSVPRGLISFSNHLSDTFALKETLHTLKCQNWNNLFLKGLSSQYILLGK